MKLWVPPYLSIRQLPSGIRLGTLPPIAWEVTEAPPFLVPLLRALSAPVERASAVETARNISGWTADEAEALIADLETARVLVPALEDRDRYDRHRLFYRMKDARRSPCRTSSSRCFGAGSNARSVMKILDSRHGKEMSSREVSCTWTSEKC